MAQRDRSQGFGFVYVDIASLFAQRDQADKERKSAAAKAQTINFNKDKVAPVTAMPPKLESIEDLSKAQRPDQERATAIQQIRNNLDRLQSLHHKLHAMLEELTNIADREKKKV